MRNGLIIAILCLCGSLFVPSIADGCYEEMLHRRDELGQRESRLQEMHDTTACRIDNLKQQLDLLQIKQNETDEHLRVVREQIGNLDKAIAAKAAH